MLEQQPLFSARTGGYHIYRIPGVLCTPRGVVLATTEARKGSGGDYDDIDILLRRSLDGGRTWEPPRKVVDHQWYGPGPANNFVMVADHDSGTVQALYSHDYRRVFHMTSADDGASFSEPVEITAVLEALRDRFDWQVVACGPGHATQLRNGRMIVPVWLSDGSGTEMGAGRRGHRPSCVSLLYSDDRGATWQCGGIVVPVTSRLNPSETLSVELSDGRVLLNIRHEGENHHRLITVSPDGVGGWAAPWYDEALREPICMASLIRWTWPTAEAPGAILFANPDSLEREYNSWAFDRKRLTVKLSLDDCQTWAYSRVLEPGPAAYSDLAILPDGTALCLYESGMLDHMGDVAAVIAARFDRDWVEGR